MKYYLELGIVAVVLFLSTLGLRPFENFGRFFQEIAVTFALVGIGINWLAVRFTGGAVAITAKGRLERTVVGLALSAVTALMCYYGFYFAEIGYFLFETWITPITPIVIAGLTLLMAFLFHGVSRLYPAALKVETFGKACAVGFILGIVGMIGIFLGWAYHLGHL